MKKVLSQRCCFNLANEGIKKAVELIAFDRLSPEKIHQMKIDAQRKVVRHLT